MKRELSLLATLCLACSVTAQTPTKQFCRTITVSDIASDPAYEWVQFGPGMSGNNKTAFWHPTDPNVMFIAPNMGNAYRTEDKGLTYQTILNCDAPSFISGLRGPKGFHCIDFSRQNPDFGFCVDEANRGIFITRDMGRSWENHAPALRFFEKRFLSSIAVDPKSDKIWYAGCGKIRNTGRALFNAEMPHGVNVDKNSMGMIWKSTDSGKSWKMMNKGIHPNAEVETILVDPANSAVVYASTTYGFYKSEDGGKSWKLKDKGLNTDVMRSMAYHYDKAADKLTFYVVANITWKADGGTITDEVGGIFRSSDRGESWENISGNLALDMRQFAKDKAIKKSYVHAAAYHFSLSDGQFLKKYPEMPSKITQKFNQIAVDPNDPDNLYLVNEYSNASRNNFSPGQLWRTKDGGKHWYITFRNGKNWEKGRDVEYWKQRGNPIGSNVTFKYLHDWMVRDAYDRKACNVACFNADGTALHTQMAKISMMSYDKGDTWVDIDDEELYADCYVGAGNSNMPGHGFYQDVRLPNQVFCCAGENSLWITRDGGGKIRKGAQAASVHKFLSEEQSLSCYAIHPKDTLMRYAMFFRQHSRGELLRSTDGGDTWASHGVAVPLWEIKAHKGDQPSHQLNLMIDPVNTDNMYFCVPKIAKTNEYVGDSEAGMGVSRSFDGGATWSPCNDGLPASCDVPAICFDPNDPNTLYACVQSKGGGLFRSSDNGGTWEQVDSTIGISGKFGINDIHFAEDGKVYITSGDKKSDEYSGGLWVSDDNMDSWDQIFEHPYVFRVETAIYDPNIIMISTLPNAATGFINPGTYLSKDGGKRWIKFNKGNGQSDRINDIAIDYTVKGKYYLSTYGSGWYVCQE